MKQALALGVIVMVGACSTVPDPQPLTFDQVLARHVAAIQSRDLDGIEATITRGEDMVLIFPDGTRYSSRTQFLDFHREWFTDKDWVMTLEPVRRWSGSDYGYALYRTSFDPDGAGPTPPRAAWLSLGFRLEDGEWRLVHDQNTRITETAGQ